MRIALLSDIHGNPIALDAVLADIEFRGGADAYWLLGDLVALGYDPVAVLEHVTALPGARFVQGNTDRYVGTGDRSSPSLADVAADPDLLLRLVEVAHTFAWTQGYVTAAGWLDWLVTLPLDRTTDGVRIVNVGSVSNPLPPDLRASYALLTAGAIGYQIELHRVHYNLDTVIAAVRRSRHPSSEFIIRHCHGPAPEREDLSHILNTIATRRL